MVLSADEDLVYADALMQAGDPRGELIVVELELARAPNPALWRRRAELRAQHAATWWPELPAQRLRTRGGFVDSITATADDLDRAVPLAARERIAEIELIDAALYIPEPWWKQLRRLIVVSDGASDLVELLDVPQLESFALRDVFISASRWSIGNGLSGCKRLDFAGQQLYDAAARILDWQHIGRVEELELSGCRIDAPTLDAILARQLPALRVLRFSGNRLGDGARPILAKHLPDLPALQRLELVENGIDAADLAVITALRPDVEVVGAYRRPARHAFEIGGSHLELVAGAPDWWSAELDGRPVDIHLTRMRRDDRSVRKQPPERRPEAQLEPIVAALVLGQPIARQLDGTAHIDLGSSLGAAHNTSVYSRETARIAISDVVSVELEEYVSID